MSPLREMRRETKKELAKWALESVLPNMEISCSGQDDAGPHAMFS